LISESEDEIKFTKKNKKGKKNQTKKKWKLKFENEKN
jgi:hypothetical protein